MPRIDAAQVEPIDQTGRPDVVLVCREEFEALHEEVSRLPERYRIPVVLCDLEGLTYQDAARRLGCPVGTIGVRLRRARERLRLRMTRRGLAPTAGLLASLLGAEVASAQCRRYWSIPRSRPRWGSRRATRRRRSWRRLRSVASTEAVLRTMALSRLKLAMHLALAVGIAATIGWLGRTDNPEFGRAGQRVSPVAAALPADAGNAAAPRSRRTPVRSDPVRPSPKYRPRCAIEQSAGMPRRGKNRPATRPGAEPSRAPGRRTSASSIRPAKRLNPETEIGRRMPGALLRGEQERGEVLFAKEWVPERPQKSRRRRAGAGLQRDLVRGLPRPGCTGRSRAGEQERRPDHGDAQRLRCADAAWTRSIPASAAREAPSFIATGPIPSMPRGGDASSDPTQRRQANPPAEPRRGLRRRPDPGIQGADDTRSPDAANGRRMSRPMNGFSSEPRRTEYAGLVRRRSNRRDPVGGAGRGGGEPARRTSGAGSAARGRAGSAGSAGRRRSRACMSSSAAPAPTSWAWRSPAIRRRPRRWRPPASREGTRPDRGGLRRPGGLCPGPARAGRRRSVRTAGHRRHA